MLNSFARDQVVLKNLIEKPEFKTILEYTQDHYNNDDVLTIQILKDIESAGNVFSSFEFSNIILNHAITVFKIKNENNYILKYKDQHNDEKIKAFLNFATDVKSKGYNNDVIFLHGCEHDPYNINKTVKPFKISDVINVLYYSLELIDKYY